MERDVNTDQDGDSDDVQVNSQLITLTQEQLQQIITTAVSTALATANLTHTDPNNIVNQVVNVPGQLLGSAVSFVGDILNILTLNKKV